MIWAGPAEASAGVDTRTPVAPRYRRALGSTGPTTVKDSIVDHQISPAHFAFLVDKVVDDVERSVEFAAQARLSGLARQALERLIRSGVRLTDHLFELASREVRETLLAN
jgi:hypothetical protein